MPSSQACPSRKASPLTTSALTRIAPTPSGFLHAGNLVNFLLVQRIAEEVGAEIVLRIDDMDVFRMRPEYVDDIFRCLNWLEIDWQHGPQSADEYSKIPEAVDRADHYFSRLEALIANGLPAFVCKCSRRDLGRDARCESGCSDKGLKLVEGKTAVRVRVPAEQSELALAMGDFVVWRREDLPAYQLQSLIDDEELGVTHIVRGRDLLDSTRAQQFLASFIPESSFMRATILHHELITGPDGEKLSKSQGTERLELTPELRTQLHGWATQIALS